MNNGDGGVVEKGAPSDFRGALFSHNRRFCSYLGGFFNALTATVFCACSKFFSHLFCFFDSFSPSLLCDIFAFSERRSNYYRADIG